MAGYRLSPLRNKGWLRAGLIVAVLMLPIAAMEHALGYFSDGLIGFAQALEFVIGGMAIALIIGLSAAWVLRGFAVRAREEEEDQDRDRAPRPAGPAASPAGDARGRHGPPPVSGGRH